MLIADSSALDVGRWAHAHPNETEAPQPILTLAELARLVGVPPPAPWLARAQFAKRRVHGGETLLRQGDRFEFLYALCDGALKTVTVDSHGVEQVLSFALGGEVVGIDGVGGVCTGTVVALGPSWVARVPYAEIAGLAKEHESVERILSRVLSEEFARRTEAIKLLAIPRSEARLAAFLLRMAHRATPHAALLRGTVVDLAMTRAEIGRYLGLRLETVCRGFSALASAKVIRVVKGSVAILDPSKLSLAAEGRPLREQCDTPREPMPVRDHVPTSAMAAIAAAAERSATSVHRK